MLTKITLSFRKNKFWSINAALSVFLLAVEIMAQMPSISAAPPVVKQGEDFTWWYVTLFVLALGLAGAIFWWLNGKKAAKQSADKTKPTVNKENGWDANALDADKELEWLRKNPKLTGKKNNQPSGKRKKTGRLPQKNKILEAKGNDAPAGGNEKTSEYLPIFSIRRLELARPFDALPISEDEDLMSAVEQTHDEFEEDEEVRDLAVRILARFKTRNAIESLSQVALYDLSSNLRSKAVTTLSEFDHESVFETILLACADPTREVRAAAARGLTKLTFDRADAWTRIAETGEEGRIVHAARAAIESGFVDMSFDRLAHQDRKYAYEAFTLMALLIKAGETEKIFDTLENHRDMNVRRAILHTIKVTKDQKALDGLYLLLERNNLPIEFQEEVDKTIEEIGFVTV